MAVIIDLAGQRNSSPLCAAQYVRMSTDHQQYSTQNQADKIREYAAKRNINIVRTYADEGKSGLRIDGRKALQELIRDVQSGEVDFQIILVYDVSRWGRFQDPDEGAYYEYICRNAGIEVAYCAEQFENDGSSVSSLFKTVKRSMAGEYSRELSAKVFAGQCRLIELGFRQGGPAGYGLRRALIDQAGTLKGELQHGEHKSLQTDRVILQPGPDSEVVIVNKMYHWFVDDNLSESEIADQLNKQGVLTDIGRLWTRATVREVLSNEKYIGNNIFNRRSFKLKQLRIVNRPEHWVRKDGAFEGIVPPALFYTAQGILRARAHRYTDEELIDKLRGLYERYGYLSGLIIDEAEGLPSSSAYAHRFGSLIQAYKTVGFTPERDYKYLEVNQFLRRLHPEIVSETERMISKCGGSTKLDPATDLLTVNGEFTVSLVLSRCQMLDNGRRRWKVRFDTSLTPDITVAVRLNDSNQATLDYYLLPRLDFGQPRIHLAEHNSTDFECYRFENLDYLYGMARRTRLRRA